MSQNAKRRERLLRLVACAYTLHQQWQRVLEKAANQLRSMSNLADQLAALRRCLDGDRGLGCLAWYPQLAALLEAKILASFERALGYVHGASETLAELCKQLRSHWKEAESLVSNIVAQQGDEASLLFSPTPESFSPSETSEWLRLLSASSLYDLTEKRATLSHLSCTPASVEHVCCVWDRKPSDDPTLAEVLERIYYTVEHVKKQ